MILRLLYRGTIRLPFGFHTGDGRRLGAVDQPLFRTPEGTVALAGTSLAGVIRSDLSRLLAATGPGPWACTSRPTCSCVVCRLMGPQAQASRRRGPAEAGLRASKLHVSGGEGQGTGPIRVRDRVGIDRRTRTAADRRKYDLELVEGEVEFPFELRLDDPEEDERLYLEAVLRRLAQGWLFLGGKTATGLGRAELSFLDRHELDWRRPQCLIEHLLGDDGTAGAIRVQLLPDGRGEWLGSGLLPAPSSAPEGEAGWAQLRLRLELDFPWGLLVNDPGEALSQAHDHAFSRLTDGRPLLPGSALRGALRSRAEQILRTLAGDGAACDLHRKGHSCHERIEMASEGLSQALSFEEELRRHCSACRVFGSGRLASAVKLTDFHPVDAAQASPRTQEFVAVDRFTGGAAEGAKFDAQVCDRARVAGELHLELSPDRLQPWGLGLLALVLRDLLCGDLPLGFGTAKGLNESRASVTGVERFWLAPPAALAGTGLDPLPGTAGWRPGEGTGVDHPVSAAEAFGEELRPRLQEWVEALHGHLKSLPQPASPREEVHRP